MFQKILGKTNENAEPRQNKIVIHAESKEEADKLFNGLSVVGGQIEGPLVIVHGVRILVVSETDMVLNGLLI